mgnify:CR=1 FL=1
MAEFRLGRIKFIWKGDWVAGTQYVKDDVVRVSGKVYVCTISHTADPDFNVDADYVPPKWNLMGDGQEWRGDWDNNVTYYKNDLVKYGGNVYLCLIGHVSAATDTLGLEVDYVIPGQDSTLSKWDLFAESFDWQSDWQANYRYKLNDTVKYGGNVYLCNTGHTSAATITFGLEGLGLVTPGVAEDLAKWDLYTEGFDWKADWAPTTRYKINDVVKFGGTLYICNEGHTAGADFIDGLEADQSKWDYFNQGIEYKEDWDNSAGINYKVNDVVKYGAGLWICLAKHQTSGSRTFEQDEDSGYWAQFVEGFEFDNSWNVSTVYQPGDVVTYGGYAYIATENHSGIKPTDPVDGNANWDLYQTGFKLQNDWSIGTDYKVGDVVRVNGYTYLAIADSPSLPATVTATLSATDRFTCTTTADMTVGMAVNFTGTVFGGVQVGVTYYIESIPSATEFRISAEQGGALFEVPTDSGTMTVTVAAKPPNTAYWERLNSGFRWLGQWQDDYDYVLGDVTRYGNSSYVCVLSHHSQEDSDSSLSQGSLDSRPDQDLNGTYWNLLAAGDENNVLTTTGDLVVYSGAGPTRLAAGDTGQTLVVSSTGIPEWKYWGEIDQLYYVGTDGVDAPAPDRGITSDRPFKTIRYAAEQIENGLRHPDAKHLLKVNRQFIQAETKEWINYQITNNIAPFSNIFTFDADKCVRDVGLVLDALAYDFSRGGNVKSREAALEYTTNAAAFYVAGQEAETNAALEYAVNDVLKQAVFLNAGPAVNYQTTNGVANPVLQQIDLTYEAEAGASTEISSLLPIITDAITAGVSTNIPAAVKPQRTILVKTGVFYEVLPIKVPVETAVVGDELRSTNVRPAGSLVNSSDVPYSLDALAFLKTLLNDVVQGTDVVELQSGVAQVIARPFATGTEGTLVQDLLDDAIDYIDFYINGNGSAPAITGQNNTVDDYDRLAAATLLYLNKEFAVAETLQYITNTYPSYTYDTDACSRDVRSYIDAFYYDLFFTGNYKTLEAAHLYVNSVQGSIQENMYLVRNGTGVRNMTVQGLTGTLGVANSYGTKRPTAGAYVSLDPGWGTADTRVWITNKSCYVQNVTTFGTACVGCKIDGDLHAGGNDSIVANDFTQVLSDGIGVWCTNLGRTELVSVFSYYGHIGYLAENGGKIRATNGNSSYGTFGCVSEGVDSTETPVTGTVNNRALEAAGRAVTDGTNQIWRVEFQNAGSHYDEATFTFNGAGINVSVTDDERRDDAIFQVRMLDLNDSSGDFGGSEYLQVENVAQGGTTTSITLSATDSAQSADYVGARIFIQSGLGAGQTGIINSYNAGSKVANIYKEDGTAGWDHSVPGLAISAPDPSSLYLIEPRLVIDAPTHSTALTVASVQTQTATFHPTRVTSSQTFASEGDGNATFDIVAYGFKYYVTMTSGGTGYAVNDTFTIAGTAFGGLSPDNDLVITVTNVRDDDPDFNIIDTFSFEGRFIGGRVVAIGVGATNIDGRYTGPDGEWNNMSLPTASQWNTIGAGLEGDKLTGTVRFVALATGSNNAAYSDDGGETWTATTTPQTGSYSSVAYGNGKFVAVRSDSATPCISNDGVLWANAGGTVGTDTNWNAIAYGQGMFVAVSSGGSAAYSTDGISWLALTVSGAVSPVLTDVAYGNGRFVAVSDTGITFVMADKSEFKAGPVLGAGTATSWVSYGQGNFVVVRNIDGEYYHSKYGLEWTTVTSLALRGNRKPTFSNIQHDPYFYIHNSSGGSNRKLKAGAQAEARARVEDGKINEIRMIDPGSGYDSGSLPTLTITDATNVNEAPFAIRVGDGALGNPGFINRGSSWDVATVTITGDGYGDYFQAGSYVNVTGLDSVPIAGSNVEFSTLPGQYYKLVTVTQILGTELFDNTISSPYSARLQLSPAVEISDAPVHDDTFEIRIRYSQCRLTGHDFLDIGTGNFTTTNYPNIPLQDPEPDSETVEKGGGRVFFTSTDQDGNFRVGDLFTVEQATGTATLNADAFNIAGLQQLQLGSVELGTGGAAINEFSTDPFFTQDSDQVVPTQRAIKAYIASQIGSGSSTLNVNTLTAGQVFVADNYITTTNGLELSVESKMNFKEGVTGVPIAMNMFIHG